MPEKTTQKPTGVTTINPATGRPLHTYPFQDAQGLAGPENR